jgi:putative DNA primase/helicase
MPFNQSPPNALHIYPSSLDEFAKPEIAAELARREQRLAGSAQPAAATPAAVPLTTAPAPSVAQPAVVLTSPPAPLPPPTATAPAALMTRASGLKYWPIDWLWPGRIARAKLTLLAGAPGSGKSTLAMSIIAAVTTGGRYPCDEGSAPDGSVILVAPGGDPDVLLPRLKAAGADLERVHIITDVTGPDGPRPFDVATDLLLLHAAIQSVKQLRVVVVDAVNLSGGRAAELATRAALDRLAILAKAVDVSVLALVQTAGADRGARKPVALDALTLGTARAAFVIEADPADANRKLLLQAKNELARDPGTLAFRLTEQKTEEDQTAARIEFEPQHHSLSAREFAARQARGFHSARAEAFEFLRSLFGSASELTIRHVEQEARAAGLIKEKQALNQCRVLRDARMAMGLAMTCGSHDSGTWVWAKPNTKPAVVSPPLQPVQPQKISQLKPSSPNAAM